MLTRFLPDSRSEKRNTGLVVPGLRRYILKSSVTFLNYVDISKQTDFSISKLNKVDNFLFWKVSIMGCVLNHVLGHFGLGWVGFGVLWHVRSKLRRIVTDVAEGRPCGNIDYYIEDIMELGWKCCECYARNYHSTLSYKSVALLGRNRSPVESSFAPDAGMEYARSSFMVTRVSPA